MKITEEKYNSFYDNGFNQQNIISQSVSENRDTKFEPNEYDKNRKVIHDKKITYIPKSLPDNCKLNKIISYGNITEDNDLNGRKLWASCDDKTLIYAEVTDKSPLVKGYKTTYRPAFYKQESDGYYNRQYMLSPENNTIILISYYPELRSTSHISIQIYGVADANGGIMAYDYDISEQLLSALKCNIDNDQLRHSGKNIDCRK